MVVIHFMRCFFGEVDLGGSVSIWMLGRGEFGERVALGGVDGAAMEIVLLKTMIFVVGGDGRISGNSFGGSIGVLRVSSHCPFLNG